MTEQIKVVALRSVKYQGKYYEPKQTLEIPEEMAIKLSKMDPPAVQLPIDLEVPKDETPEGSSNDEGGNGNNNDTDPMTKEEVVELFSEIDLIEEDHAEQLFDLGIDSVEKLKACTAEKLQEVNGFGPSTADKLLVILEEIEVEDEE